MNVVNKKLSTAKLKDVGLILIGAYCMMCSIYVYNFAKLNITIAGMPLFTGEMLLFISAAIFAALVVKKKVILSREHKIFFVYLGFIVTLILFDFVRYHGRALALRNGMMFIYPIFALFTYTFYSSSFIPARSQIFLSAIFLLTAILTTHNGLTNYFNFCFFIISTFAIRNQKQKWLVLIVGLVLWPYGNFLSNARTWVVASIITGLVLSFIFMFFYFGVKRIQRLAFTLLVACVIIILASRFSEKGGLKTLVNPMPSIAKYMQTKEIIRAKEDSYARMNLDVQSYSTAWEGPNHLGNIMRTYGVRVTEPEEQLEFDPNKTGKKTDELTQFSSPVDQGPEPKNLYGKMKKNDHVLNRPKISNVVSVQEKNKEMGVSKKKNQDKGTSENYFTVTESDFDHSASEWKKDRRMNPLSLTQIIRSQETVQRNVDVAYNNIVFRCLIWEDMIKELIQHNAWLGMGMGWPQRSRNIEILGWAYGEWSRDGWIAPHNSGLHIIYRLGVLGVLIILFMTFSLYHMVKIFVLRRQWQGIILCSALFYGLIGSNFLLILELPYYAIAFWSLWGLTLWQLQQRKVY